MASGPTTTLKRLVTGLVAVAAMTTVLAPRAPAGEPEVPAPLSPSEFERLRQGLDLKRRPWARLPWKISVTDARRAAAEQGKPVFMQLNAGNCLGSV